MKRRSRDEEIWRRYACGSTLETLAREFGLAISTVGSIVEAARQKYVWSKDGKRQELAQQLDWLREEMTALVDAEPAPMFRGTEPVVDRDEKGEIVKRYEDHSGRVNAAETLLRIQARMAKMLGLDAAEVVDQTTTVRYSFEGVDTEELT